MINCKNIKSGIYGIIDGNEVIYVGKSVNLKRRISEHFASLRKNKHYNPYLQKIYNKRCNNIEIDVLDTCNKENLEHMERYWMNMFLPKTNMMPASGPSSKEFREYLSKKYKGVKRPNLCGRKLSKEEISRRTATRRINGGYELSDERRKEISNRMRGRKVSPETKEKLRLINTGRKASPETKEKLRLSHLGKSNLSMKGKKLSQEEIDQRTATRKLNNKYTMTDEHKRKIYKANKGRKLSDETKEKIRKMHIGRKASDEARKNMSLAHSGKPKLHLIGRKLSKETIDKRTETRRKNGGYIVSNETKLKISIASKLSVNSGRFKKTTPSI